MPPVSVTCWCEDRIVGVPVEMVRKGLTYPCRLPKCIRISAANGVFRPTRRGTGRATGLEVSEMQRTVHSSDSGTDSGVLSSPPPRPYGPHRGRASRTAR